MGKVYRYSNSPGAELVRGILARHGLRAWELALLVGVHPFTLSRWVRGYSSVSRAKMAALRRIDADLASRSRRVPAVRVDGVLWPVVESRRSPWAKYRERERLRKRRWRAARAAAVAGDVASPDA